MYSINYMIRLAGVRGHVMIWLLSCLIIALLSSGCGAGSVDTASTVDKARESIASVGPSAPASSFVYKVPSGSMEPTLPIGTRVLVERGPLTVGAIVVARPPEGFAALLCGPKPHRVKPGGAACDAPIPEGSHIERSQFEGARSEVIKRIVAAPGDAIYIREGHVYRRAIGSGRFIRESDPYIRACGSNPECNFPIPIKIPAGHWFLMGDNRGESYDSRDWGPIPTTWIMGVATSAHRHTF